MQWLLNYAKGAVNYALGSYDNTRELWIGYMNAGRGGENAYSLTSSLSGCDVIAIPEIGSGMEAGSLRNYHIEYDRLQTYPVGLAVHRSPQPGVDVSRPGWTSIDNIEHLTWGKVTGRQALVTCMYLNRVTVLVVSLHLKSGAQHANAATQELRDILTVIEPYHTSWLAFRRPAAVVLAGDFNHADPHHIMLNNAGYALLTSGGGTTGVALDRIYLKPTSNPPRINVVAAENLAHNALDHHHCALRVRLRAS